MSPTDREARLASRFAERTTAPPAEPIRSREPAPGGGALYRRGSVYLTAEQGSWLKGIVHEAQGEGLNLSASDVIRLALDRLRDELPWQEMRPALIERAHIEARTYPGRAKRGLPPLEG